MSVIPTLTKWRFGVLIAAILTLFVGAGFTAFGGSGVGKPLLMAFLPLLVLQLGLSVADKRVKQSHG